MNFTQIRTFYLVATMGTYQKAADKLNTSQPTVSARITAIENWLNAPLFDRSSHRAKLTPKGWAFLEVAKRMLELEEEARDAVGDKGGYRGTYRIGAADSLAMTWLASFMMQLREMYPKATFDFKIGTSPVLAQSLVQQELDLCFMIGPSTEPNVASRTLCTTPVVLAASPNLMLHEKRRTLTEVGEYTILTFERRTQTYQSILRAFDRANLAPKLSGVSSLAFAVALAREGYGIIAVPAIAIQKELEDGSLVVVSSDLEPESPTFAACYLTGPLDSIGHSIAAAAFEHLANSTPPNLVVMAK
ncbi:DNA-binding transcriptional LysR family regulator [Pseudorhizobium tarimense]|uniref:DNA-binding transcriptional LysR family regulator n=1 Tax=Pseudorhizobium tarimense TaxID=1079109 RepID=A0ABV2H6N1_9HYPH|nr:LysR family transcriptional regulator [Pseudorhizobium tarimense]MCJ8519089.1 LysR family transcriptional regulator [Pseudorhizobium tarimense]